MVGSSFSGVSGLTSKGEKTCDVDDIIVALLNFFPQEQRKFSGDRRKLHTTLFNLREAHPKFMKEFIFDTRDFFPYSKDVDRALWNLQISSLLEQSNPNFEMYEIKPKLRKFFENFLANDFSDEEKKELVEMSKDFQKNILP